MELKKGLSSQSSVTVSAGNTAAAMGSGDLDVFATPAMVALMENAAMKAVADALPEGSTTVGAEMNVTHIKPSGLGAEIVPVQGFAEAIVLVLQGRADATANDLISFQTYQEEHPEASFRLLDEELPDDTTVGVIMQQDQDALLDEVDAILEEMKQDGSLTAIYEEWVGQDITPES